MVTRRSRATAEELLKPCLKAALQQQNALAKRLFTGQGSFEQTFAGVQDSFIYLTEIPIERPDNQDLQRSQYSGKKTTHRKMAPDL
ncbi:hypothetical protein [Hymenobacter roseosalivarius]|uniref:hypothetical protein n=1 Tax=Hymenobacter roseosalivarius TaxID=89967 RepID=UPI00190EC437|nr:hypothetical protein [Hymenobacter roseosalivarius]